MGENMYCGAGPVPKGKIRGTPEYCVQTNQIRYYGLVAIDKDLLKTAKGQSSDLIKEQLKLKKIEDDAKVLIKEVKNLKIILDSERSSTSEVKRAKKKMEALLEKRDKLVKRLKVQKKVVDAIVQDEKEKEKSNKSSSKSSKKK